MPQALNPRQPSIRQRPRVPERDRKRIAKACLRCRDRKSRCIIARKVAQKLECQRCLQKGVDCVFGDVVGDASSIPRSSMADSSQLSPIQSSLNTTNNVYEATTNGTSGEDLLVDMEVPQCARLVVRNSHQTHFIGEVSNRTFLSEVQDTVVPISPHNTSKELQSEFSQMPNLHTIDPTILSAAQQGFPPKTIATFLVQVFFHVVEANYYYMDREEFKRRLQTWYDDPSAVELNASFMCLALMVFAMASQFAEIQESGGMLPLPAVLEEGPGIVFYQKAKLLLSEVVTQCSLESIQACFLMGLFLLPSNLSDLSYVYHGIAMKMAISAGLHRKITGSDLDQRVLHVRNRLWWSLYTSERRLTIILDRPESIQESDIDAPFPDSDQDLDSLPVEDNIANLQASITLFRIFNDAVRVTKTYGFDTEGAAGRIAQVQKSLEEWAENLPNALQLNNLNPTLKPFRGAVHLHMNYNQIMIYMGRRFLLRNVQHNLNNRYRNSSITTYPTTTSASCNDSLAATLTRKCISAAFDIIELIHYLLESGKLARFSFTDVNCCSTAALIIITNEIVQRHPLYGSSMEKAMQAMSYMATGCRMAKQSYKLIQNLHEIVVTLRSRSSQQDPLEKATVGQTTGYREWKNWLGIENRYNASDSSLSLSREQEELATTLPPVGFDKPPIATASSETEDDITGMPGQDMQHSTQLDDIQDFFYTWPDNLDALGLSGFEDFAFPVT